MATKGGNYENVKAIIQSGKPSGLGISIPSQRTSAELGTRRQLEDALSKISATKKDPSSLTRKMSPSILKYLGNVSDINVSLSSLYQRVSRNVKEYSEIIKNVGGEQVEISIKQPESVLDKIARRQAEGKLEYDFDNVPDVIRGRVIVKNEAQIDDIVKNIRSKVPIVDDEDFFLKPNGWGYRGRNLNIRLSDGSLAEIQIHTEGSLRAQEKIHPLYEN